MFEESGGETTPLTPKPHNRKRSSVGRFPISIVNSPTTSPKQQIPDPMTTVLNLSAMPKGKDGLPLTRKTKNKDGKDIEVDFWGGVVSLDVNKMEAVMKMASVEKEYSLNDFISGIEYQGFNRLFYIQFALTKMSVSLFCRFAVLGAIRGSNFTRILETCENMPADMSNKFTSLGFVKTPKKKDHLTILRCTASIPHWCAFYMMRASVVKKLDMACPASIQFPGAASLPMSREVRIQHIEFCMAFSALLPGGQFRVSIYLTAMSNQIPVADIPEDVLSVVRVSSNAESYKLTDDDLARYSKQLITTK